MAGERKHFSCGLKDRHEEMKKWSVRSELHSLDEINWLGWNVSDKSVGNWKRRFDQRTIATLEPLISPAMETLGYF